MASLKILEGKDQYTSGGLYTAQPKHALKDGQSPFIRNVDFARAVAAINKRRGISLFQAALTGTGTCTGLYEYFLSSGTSFMIASNNNTVYSITGGVATLRYTGSMAGANTEYTTFKDLLIMVASTEATQQWDGVSGSFSTLLGTPPANGKYTAVWKGKTWIANTSAGKSRLHGSATNNPSDWITANDALFVDINPNDGDEITGLKALMSVLVIFKRNSTHFLYGSTVLDFLVRPVSLNQGCLSHRSIVNMGPFLMYVSRYAVHSLNPFYGSQAIMSQAIRYDIENLSLATKALTAASRYKNQYWLAFDPSGNATANTQAYVLDSLDGSWSLYDNQNVNVFCERRDGTLLSGGSDVAKIRQHDNGENDEGTAITMRWRSRAYDADDFTALKQLIDIWAHCAALAGATLGIRTLVDGVQVEDVTRSLTPKDAAQTDTIIGLTALDSPSIRMQGRLIQLEFYNAESSSPVQIFQHGAEMEVIPRQFTEQV